MKWHNYSEEKPTVEGEYLTCRTNFNKINNNFYEVCKWSNNLYEVDTYEFYSKQGECGFWVYDSEVGCCLVDCDYWCEIEFNEV